MVRAFPCVGGYRPVLSSVHALMTCRSRPSRWTANVVTAWEGKSPSLPSHPFHVRPHTFPSYPAFSACTPLAVTTPPETTRTPRKTLSPGPSVDLGVLGARRRSRSARLCHGSLHRPVARPQLRPARHADHPAPFHLESSQQFLSCWLFHEPEAVP